MASAVGVSLDDIVTAARSATFEQAPMGRPRHHPKDDATSADLHVTRTDRNPKAVSRTEVDPP